MQALVIRALMDRIGGDLPRGAVYQIRYVNRLLLDDQPVVTAVWRQIRDEIRETAVREGIDLTTGGEIHAHVFTPEDLREAWEKHVWRIDGDPMEPLPLENVAAFFAYWAPETKPDLRALLANATPRPWFVYHGEPWAGSEQVVRDYDAGRITDREFEDADPNPGTVFHGDVVHGPDTELIVAAVNALPDLLDRLDQIREAVAEPSRSGGRDDLAARIRRILT